MYTRAVIAQSQECREELLLKVRALKLVHISITIYKEKINLWNFSNAFRISKH